MGRNMYQLIKSFIIIASVCMLVCSPIPAAAQEKPTKDTSAKEAEKKEGEEEKDGEKNNSKKAKLPFDYASNNILYYEECVSGGTAASSSAGSSDEPLPSTVPEPWRTLINNAAEKHPDSDRRIVAATLWVENRGWPKYADSNDTLSKAAALGFWQFIPSTWDALGEDGDGDGIKDPKNPKDAVHAAFKHSPNSAGLPILDNATGNIKEDYEKTIFLRNRKNTMSFVASYNGTAAPDNMPINDLPKVDPNPEGWIKENSDYIRMGYWLIASGFRESIDINDGYKVIDATTRGPGAEGGTASDIGVTSDSGAAACSGGKSSSSANVNADGYAFPIGLSKHDVSPSAQSFPCKSDTFCYHHDGSPAFDLSNKEWGTNSSVGTAVFAIYDGTITNISNRNGYSHCIDIVFTGDDGWGYWYGHMTNPTVQSGQKVKAGDKLGEVGPTECADSTPSHLHIDRGSPKGRGGGVLGARDTSFVPLMDSLWKELPE